MTDPRPTAPTESTAAEPTPTEPTPAEPVRRRPSRRQLVIAAGVLVALLAAGVGYALTRSVEPGYGSPEAISALLAERGAPCEDFDSDGEGRADKRGTCYVDGERVIIATFGSRAEVEAHWERQLATAAENDVIGMVIGDKWTVTSTARAYLRHAAEVLHAEYRSN